MFFKDIDNWTKKKLLGMTISMGFLYFLFATLIPIIIVCTRYEIFKQQSFKLTAAGLIVIIIVVTVGYKAIHFLVDMLPEVERKEQILKYSIQLVCALIIPLVALWIVHLIKVNVDLALGTLKYCLWSWIAAIVVDYVGFKSLRYKWSCIAEAKKQNKIDRIKNSGQAN